MNEEYFYSEEVLDECLKRLGEQIKEEESKPHIINPPIIRKILLTKALLKKSLEGTEMQITHELGQPFLSMGSITVSAADLWTKDKKGFLNAIKTADVVEIYARTDGKIVLELTFHNAMLRID